MAVRYVEIGQYPDVRREVRGKLSEILVATANPGTYAAPEDVTGTFLEMGADGLWAGASVGTMPKATADALYASGALANLATGATYRDTSGTQYTYNGAGAGWAAVAPLYIDRPLRLATFGDSTAEFGSQTCDTEILTQTLAQQGASPCAVLQSKCTVASWVRSVLVANGGIGMQTTQQFLDRGKGAWSSTRKALRDILYKQPDVVLLHGASINDFYSMTPATTQAAIAAVVARHTLIARYFTSRGVHVLDSGCYGYSGAQNAANHATVRAILLAANDIWKSQADSDDLWHFVDMSGVTHDGSGAFNPGISDDGWHLNSNGGYVVGRAEYGVLRTVFDVNGVRGGEILWDETDDFANYNTITNYPANFPVTPTNATVVSVETTQEKCVICVDSADGGYLTAYIGNYGGWQNMLSKVKAGDGLLLDVLIRVFDESGVEVFNQPQDVWMFKISDASGNWVVYDNKHGRNTGVAKVWQLYSPIDYSAMTSAQVFFNQKLTNAGRYYIHFYPCTLRKWTPLNVASA